MEQSTKRKRSAPTEHTTVKGITVTSAKKKHIKFDEEDLNAADPSTLCDGSINDQDDVKVQEDYDEDEDSDDAPEEVTISESRKQILRAEDASSRLIELQSQTAKRKRRELDAKLKLQKSSSTKDVPARTESDKASRLLPTETLEKAVIRDKYLDTMEDRTLDDLSRKTQPNNGHTLLTAASQPRSTRPRSNNSIQFSGSMRLQIHDASEEATNKILAPVANKNSKNCKDMWKAKHGRSRQHGLQPLKRGFLRT